MKIFCAEKDARSNLTDNNHLQMNSSLIYIFKQAEIKVDCPPTLGCHTPAARTALHYPSVRGLLRRLPFPLLHSAKKQQQQVIYFNIARDVWNKGGCLLSFSLDSSQKPHSSWERLYIISVIIPYPLLRTVRCVVLCCPVQCHAAAGLYRWLLVIVLQ